MIAAAAVAIALALAGAPVANTQKAVFAGGCFWGVEGVFEHVKGVVRVTSGYAGGALASPSYEQVGSGTTGHAESVEIVFDPSKITYRKLLEIFFSVAHDPTELNHQGPDWGPEYRSAVFYGDAEQKREVESYVAELTQKNVFDQPIVTELAPLKAFYPAEEYHQDFMARHPLYPYIVINDRPKVEALKRRFPELYREPSQTATR